ncbi:alpha/beta fold hydrolase [Rhizorhabdus argentea]|uniref:alpha/beta fold hydrolase n=1 Tax=Rhizorhabdus argentea TaxID=1387174 RepID=UPI0030EF1025
MPYVKVNGVSFYYEDDNFTDPWCEPEVVFIQHGWGRSSKFFYHWVPPLAGRYRVLRRDMRGHGLSDDPLPGVEWSVDELVEDMAGFLDELGVDQIHYIGESAGGVLGVAFAVRFPERVRSLTLLSSPLSDPTRNSEDYGYSDLAGMIATTPIDEFLDMNIKGRGVVATGPAHEKWLRAEWRKNRSENLAALARLFPSIDLTPAVSTLEMPTLILAPANSRTAPLSDQQKMHDLVPDSRIKVIEGTGHELFFEKFDECIAAVTSFLRSVEKKPSNA